MRRSVIGGFFLALKAVTTKIAKSSSLFKDGKNIFYAVIDPMIPTFTYWKISK